MDEENSYYCEDTAFSENIKPNRDDTRYCKELSRKAVARAALYLGVEKMNRDALHLVADSLLYYLEIIGNVLVEMVQKSRRTSAHCNVLDVLQAVDVCTAPVAHQVTMRWDEELNLVKTQAATADIRGNIGRECSDIDSVEFEWEGLAHFLFGKNWLSIPLVGISEGRVNKSIHNVHSKQTNNIVVHETYSNEIGKKTTIGTTSDKLISEAVLKDVDGAILQSFHPYLDSSIKAEEKTSTKYYRWNAPFVGIIPHFPISRSSCEIANPHKLPSSISSSFHCWSTNDEACGIDFYHHPSQCYKQYLEKNPLYEHTGDTFGEEYSEIINLEATNNFSKKILSSRDASTPLIMTGKTIDLDNLHIPDNYILNGNVIFWGAVRSQDKSDKEKKSSAHKANVSDEVLLWYRGNVVKPSVDNKKDTIPFDTKRTSYGVDIYKRYNDHSTNGGIKKKVKVNDSKNIEKIHPNTTASNLPKANDTELVEKTYRRPRYVPSFYPPFPSEYATNYLEKLQSGISILDVVTNSMCKNSQENNYLKRLHTSTHVKSPNTNNYKNYQGIRSSLVSLESSIAASYWGTDYRSNHTLFRTEKNSESVNSSSSISSNSLPTVLLKKTQVQIRSEPNILPLGKASGSRISRILEGSMDL